MNTTHTNSYISLLLISLFSACTTQPADEIEHYLYIGHPRGITDEERMDSIIENIPYASFEIRMIGGDITPRTSLHPSTLNYVDSVFDLSAPTTLWAAGNHDYDQPELVSQYTQRPTFYTFSHRRCTFVVLDTEIDSCSIKTQQLAMINTLADTLMQSDYLFVIHHRLIWLYNQSQLQASGIIPNGPLGDCSYCIFPNNFQSEILPLLQKIQQRGIQVFCIGGDIGFHSKQFQYRTADSIYYMASGIKSTDTDNYLLLFTHNITQHTLSWQFKPMDEFNN